jgi:polysaccharide export outer membrane protein
MKRRFLIAALLLFGVATSALAQALGGWDAGRPQLTRAELTDLLIRLEQGIESGTLSSELRGQAVDEIAMIKARLVAGDIRVGDQVSLVVEGEDSLSQRFTVRPGEILTLPGIGDIPVGGVLRSELEAFLTEKLSVYIRDPVVHAESLVRVTIAGNVVRPGFYSVRADRLLSDAIMEAGGPGVTADLNSIYINRANERIWSGRYLQQAIADGRTLDQLSLQAGDQIFVPMQRPGISSRLVSVGLGVLSATALVLTILTRM